MVYFFSFLGGGVLFLFMAFFIGLPTLLLSPSKFALFFTLGCCFVMSGFASLKGWRSQMAHMLQRERLPFSAGGWCGWVGRAAAHGPQQCKLASRAPTHLLLGVWQSAPGLLTGRLGELPALGCAMLR